LASLGILAQTRLRKIRPRRSQALRGGLEVRPGTTVSLSLENIADKDYRVLGSGSNSPSRNLVLTFDARF
jgi:hypothetical protein